MSLSTVDIFEKLIDGYVKAPPSFQEALMTLAIQLYQNDEIKKSFIFEPEPLKYNYDYFACLDKIVERFTNLCQKLPLSPALKKELISHIRPIALKLMVWTQNQEMFDLSPSFVNSCLKPSDWTVVEMRLDVKKIAKRLVQDVRIPVFQRYRMACFHCIEDIIPSLWGQISPEGRSGLLLHEELESVKLWNVHLDGDVDELIPRNREFWDALLTAGVWDESISSVLQCWGKLDINVRQGVLKDAVMRAASRCDSGFNEFNTDILCFLLAQISKEQRGELFQEIFQDTQMAVLSFFVRWPYLDLLVPIIKELWNILPEVQYGHLLCQLAYTYCDEYRLRETYDHMEYEYGCLIIEILEETPDRFKRYAFGNNYPYVFEKDGILCTILNKGHLKLHYKEYFKHIWKHVTLEEKRLFLRSHSGTEFCSNLAVDDNGDLLNSILRECFPEDEIHIFMKKLQI